MIGWRSVPILLMAVIGLSAQCGEQIYRWVDEKGMVHYSGTVPTEEEYEQVEMPKLTPAVPTDSLQEVQEQLEQLEQLEKQQREGTRDEELDAFREERQALMEQECAQAQEALRTLQSHARVLLYDEETGQAVHLTQEERQEELDRTQRAVDYYCGTP
jgi:hypothetical protein